MQDRARWDRELIGRGFAALGRSATGSELSAYHLEAAIASLHCAAPTYEATDWPQILDLYETLLRLRPSPIVALNRAIALGKARGPEAALATLPDADRLRDYPFYPAAQGELHLLAGHPAEAAKHFRQATALARSPTEAAFFERKLAACGT
ncbi:MAG: polymerase sigma-70 factor, subfamily [Acidobacteria bacterium]|nr:polymerase sigma-70 factor, subfamily [Acidobacteriota bacterium]